MIISAAIGIANAAGPSPGGILTEGFGWRSLFYVKLPVGLALLVDRQLQEAVLRRLQAGGIDATALLQQARAALR
jgi:MFS family permease